MPTITVFFIFPVAVAAVFLTVVAGWGPAMPRRDLVVFAGLLLVGAWSISLLLVSLLIVGGLPGYGGSFYRFTTPFIGLAGLCVILSFAGIIARSVRKRVSWIVLPLHAALPAPWAFAAAKWPGGDDGPGLAWFILVGGGACLASVLGMAALIGVWISSRCRQTAELGAAPNGGLGALSRNPECSEGPPSVS